MQFFMWISLLALGAVSVAVVSFYLFMLYCATFHLRCGFGHDSQTPFHVYADCIVQDCWTNSTLPFMIFRKMLEHQENYYTFDISEQQRIYVVYFRRSICNGL
jgi:hypothetical protein